jgi:hypothetical protein
VLAQEMRFAEHDDPILCQPVEHIFRDCVAIERDGIMLDDCLKIGARDARQPIPQEIASDRDTRDND